MSIIKEIFKKIIESVVMLLGIVIVIIPQFITHYLFELRDWVFEKL